MRLGFDAKRAFFNRSGLGNYSRFIIQSLVKFHNENDFFLYTPKTKNHLDFIPVSDNIHISSPRRNIHKTFASYWRSIAMAQDLVLDKLDIYHGLSGEIPKKINISSIKSVVTIHDLIFLRYPELYKTIDRKIYEQKFRYACSNADKIIAISEQTKRDIIQFFSIDDKKIEVIYQGCDERFSETASLENRAEIKTEYKLPDDYLLYVGTIEERKNLLTIVKAIHYGNISSPLVVIGKKTRYYNKVINYIEEHNIKNIHFLSRVSSKHLPAIYQMAKVFIYPSIFEGFGIPIIEALSSKVPVITSKGGCFSEAGGPSSIYITPNNYELLGEEIIKVLGSEQLQEKMISDGTDYLQKYSHKKLSEQLINLYQKLVYA